MFSIVFPGQGSQSRGMLQAWSKHDPVILETFSEASDRLHYDVWELTQAGPEEKLNQTEFTQPALLTASVALYRILHRHLPLQPRFLAGHSLGEYTALVCSGALSFSDAVKLVEMRGRFMQAAVPLGQGAMAAIIGLRSHQVQSLCDAVSTEENSVSSANYNADAQIVIAGHTAAVDSAIQKAIDLGAKLAKKLPMSVPSHCVLMKPAADALAMYLEKITINTPSLPVLHNVDVETHSSPEAIKRALVEQLYKPVRWTETITKMKHVGVKWVIECGPGKVLAGLCKRIESSPEALSLNEPNELQRILDEVT